MVAATSRATSQPRVANGDMRNSFKWLCVLPAVPGGVETVGVPGLGCRGGGCPL